MVVGHQAWAQHNLLISDAFFEGDSIDLEKKDAHYSRISI
jgi:hypothetical protein